MALSTTNKIYIGLGALVLLGGGVYMSQEKARKEQARITYTASSADLPKLAIPEADTKKVTKIAIKNANKSDVVLEKKGDKWQLTKPVSYAANERYIKSLLSNFKDLKVKEQVEKTNTSFKEYKLDDAQAVHVQIFKGGDKALDIFLGKSGGRGQMARIEGKTGVFAVKGYSSYLYTRAIKDWRDSTILKFDDKKASLVSIKNESGLFTFTKDGDSWTSSLRPMGKKGKLEKKGKAIKDFSSKKVDEMLRSYKSLSADDFPDGKSAKDMGLEEPTSVVSIKVGEKVHKISVGKTAKGKSRYLMLEGNKQGFTASSWAMDWAVAKVEKFQDAAAAKKKAEEKKKGDDKKKKAPVKKKAPAPKKLAPRWRTGPRPA